MRKRILTIRDVSERQLCTGCGACAYIAPDRYEMVDDQDLGRRPLSVASNTGSPSVETEQEAMFVCPGHSLEHDFHRSDPELIDELVADWGPVYRMWEGYAGDSEVRWSGSSGGASTALALYCLEKELMYGTLHIAPRQDRPYLNETVLSTTRGELLAATGSRYAPASPCDGLDMVESASGPCVFIGKPCDVAAVQRARRIRPRLDERLGLTIAFFCAGTPSTKGTLALLKSVGIDNPDRVVGMRYRGEGWPGRWTVRVQTDNASVEEFSMSYEDSWGLLQAHRQWRCYICPDHTGEFADVAVGDPWYRSIEPGEAGSSLILARTKEGRRMVEQAAEAGYLVLREVTYDFLPRSQPNLLKTRGRLWGQLLVLRILGAPTPRYRGMPTFRVWWSVLGWTEKLRSVGGTAKRVFNKGLLTRVSVNNMAPVSNPGSDETGPPRLEGMPTRDTQRSAQPQED